MLLLISLIFLPLGANAFNCPHQLLAICIACQDAKSTGLLSEVSENPVVDHPFQMVTMVVMTLMMARMYTSLTGARDHSRYLTFINVVDPDNSPAE